LTESPVNGSLSAEVTLRDVREYSKSFAGVKMSFKQAAYLVNYSLKLEHVRSSVMLVVHVFVHVKPDQVEAFETATLENARNSTREPGVARFDVIRQQDDPTRFVLVEVYCTSEDPARHKDTAHYQKWRDTVADMMAEPRTSIKYTNVFPDEQGWD